MAPTSTGQRRLAKEYAELARNPPPYIIARPREDDILEAHFIIRGPEDSPFAGGEYWGILAFTRDYPFAPPGIKMMTPSGRFQPDKKICFSMSDFHPGTWNPAWSISTILTGLLSFMLENELTTGSLRTSDSEKRRLAAQSHAYNITQTRFKQVFPEYATAEQQRLPNMGEKERGPEAQARHQQEQQQKIQRAATASSPTAQSGAGSGAAQSSNNGRHDPPPPPPQHGPFSSVWVMAGAFVLISALFSRLFGSSS